MRAISNRPGRFDPPSEFDSPLGKLNVTASRRHGDRWLVHFAQATDRTAAENLAGCPLWAAPITDATNPRAEPGDPSDPGEPGDLWVHELIGSEVVDQHGIERGQVVSVQANPAADLLELADGNLVPLTFVTTAQPGRIEVDAPDGLFEINQS